MGIIAKVSKKHGHTPLYISAENGRVEVARALLAAGSNVNQADTTYRYTPLHAAAENGQLEVVSVKEY
eukprot:8643564-Pyramimonas_sp.AAC.1